MNWLAGTRTTWTLTLYEFQKGNMLPSKPAGDSIATGSTIPSTRRPSACISRSRHRAASPLSRDASYSYDKDSKVLTITGDDGTQQVMTKID